MKPIEPQVCSMDEKSGDLGGEYKRPLFNSESSSYVHDALFYWKSVLRRVLKVG